MKGWDSRIIMGVRRPPKVGRPVSIRVLVAVTWRLTGKSATSALRFMPSPAMTLVPSPVDEAAAVFEFAVGDVVVVGVGVARVGAGGLLDHIGQAVAVGVLDAIGEAVVVGVGIEDRKSVG